MVASIAYIAAHYVVGVIRFRYQIAGVYADLQNVVSRFHICDINPLAIDVSIVSVVTARTQSLRVRCTRVSSVIPVITGGIFKAETCFVSFSNFSVRAGV